MSFRHLHIVACSPRSGTTLLHEAMVTCFRVDKHYDHEIRFHQVTGEPGEVVLSKRPKDTMYIEALLDAIPDFYVIYVLRDPRDVIVSRHGKNREMYYSNIRLWRQMHGYARTLYGHDRFLLVRYEDFVADPDVTQREIAARFPWLDTLHPFSDYHLHADVSEKSLTAMNSVRPIAPTSVGAWQDNLARIKGQQQIHGSLTPELIECGYERSAAWEAALDGVESDMSGSRYPEKVYFWTRFSQYINALRKVSVYRRQRSRH